MFRTGTSGRPDGVLLTKINPAYMTRLVGELLESEGYRLHITSLRPIRPGNIAGRCLGARRIGEVREGIPRGARADRPRREPDVPLHGIAEDGSGVPRLPCEAGVQARGHPRGDQHRFPVHPVRAVHPPREAVHPGHPHHHPRDGARLPPFPRPANGPTGGKPAGVPPTDPHAGGDPPHVRQLQEDPEGRRRRRPIPTSWMPVDSYITDHSEAKFSHGICPECAKALYGWSEKETPPDA